MNKKMVLLVLIASSVLLWTLSSLFIAFVKAVPDGVGFEENCLAKQDFATAASPADTVNVAFEEAGRVELYYDDGTAEHGWWWSGAGGMFAVRFTPPTFGQLLECSFYIYDDPVTILVHVLDTDKNDVITPFPETPTSTGWFHVDLSAYAVTVSPDVDFYVAMESTVADAPHIGADTSDPDGRSWDYDGTSWSQWWDDDYMIRAVIGTVADLKITDVYLEPSKPMPGDDVTFYADVENRGSENATEFVVELYLDEELIASGIKSLAAGANITYYYATWTATLGNHTVRWVVDATNVIDESNEDNNEMSRAFIVGYVLTVQTPYSHITVKIDGYSNSTDIDGNFQTIVDQGYHDVEVQTPVPLESGSQGVFVQWIDGSSSNPRTIFVDNNISLTAEYMTQYYLTVVSPYGTSGGEGWCDNCTTAYATLDTSIVDHGNGTRRIFTHWSVNGNTWGTNYAQSDPIIMDAPKTAIANWRTQYQLIVRTSGLGTCVSNVYNGTNILGTASDAAPYTGWFDKGSMIMLDIDSPITVDSQKFMFTHWSGDASGTDRPTSLTMNSAKDATANYKTQYLITFDHTGLDTTANSVVVTVNGAPKNFGALPFSFWADEGDTITYSYSSTVTSTVSGKRFSLKDVTGPASPITVTASVAVTGNYKTQHEVTFDQTDVGSDYTGTVVNVDEADYCVGDLPVSFWWDESSTHNFAFQSPSLVSSDTKRYVWTSTSGLSTLQSGSLTVSTSGSVTGNYKTQCYLTVGVDPQGIATVSGEGWYDAETSATTGTAQLTISGVDVRYDFDTWRVDGADVSGNPLSITMDSPHTAIAIYKTLKVSSIPPLSLSRDTIKIDKTITVSGSIVPAYEGAIVTLTYERPDGSTLARTVTSSSAGTFSDTYTPDASGIWSVTASWPGDVNNLGATSPSTSFKVEPIGWKDYLAKPEVIGLLIGLFSVICTVTAFATTRRKRGRVKTLMNEIDSAYLRFKINTRRCEAELYRLKDIVSEEYKNGKIIEASYNILNKRVDDYLKEVREQIINEKLGGFPGKLRDELHRMIENREITAKEFSALGKLLTRTVGLTESEKEELRSLLEKWKKDYLKD